MTVPCIFAQNRLNCKKMYLLFSVSSTVDAGGSMWGWLCSSVGDSTCSLLAALVIWSRVDCVWRQIQIRGVWYQVLYMKYSKWNTVILNVTLVKVFWGNETFVFGRGASGLRMGPLFGFAVDALSGPNFLLDIMLSRMFAIRGWLDEADGFPEPWTCMCPRQTSVTIQTCASHQNTICVNNISEAFCKYCQITSIITCT